MKLIAWGLKMRILKALRWLVNKTSRTYIGKKLIGESDLVFILKAGKIKVL